MKFTLSKTLLVASLLLISHFNSGQNNLNPLG